MNGVSARIYRSVRHDLKNKLGIKRTDLLIGYPTGKEMTMTIFVAA